MLDAFRAGEQVGGDAELDELTPREREVLQLIARGYMYKEIAARLHLSVKTVESHVSNVLRKLQLSTQARARAVGDAAPAGLGDSTHPLRQDANGVPAPMEFERQRRDAHDEI